MAIDRHILRGLRTAADPGVPIGPEWLRYAMIDVTAIGGTTGLTLLSVGTIGFLLVSRKYATSLFVAGSVIGVSLLGTLLKLLYDRPRPDIVPHLVQVFDTSFPSGHAMNSAAVFPHARSAARRHAGTPRGAHLSDFGGDAADVAGGEQPRLSGRALAQRRPRRLVRRGRLGDAQLDGGAPAPAPPPDRAARSRARGLGIRARHASRLIQPD
ncbi:MAG: phosphatase PAP2 family protein [Sphingomonas sp.]